MADRLMTGSLRVLFVTEDPALHGLAACYQRAFKKAGHEAAVFFLLGPRVDNIVFKALSRTKLAMESYLRKRLSVLFKETKAFRPDLIFICKGNTLEASTVDELRSISGAIMLNLYTDNPNVDPGHAMFGQLSSRLARYDCVFSSSKSLIPVFYLCGAPKVALLPFAHDPALHQPATVNPSEKAFYESPVACLSTWGALHEQWLEHLAPFGLKIWGKHWHHLRPASPLIHCWQKPGATEVGVGADMAKVCGCSSIVFNLVRAEHGCLSSMKTFELPACGAFVISNRTDEQLEYFEEDRCAVYFSTAQELLEKVRFYLQHQELREKIAASAYAEVSNRHTYSHRLETILSMCRQLRK